MQTISNELPPLKGVVHSAGVLDDGILAQLDWDSFARLFEPRVYGSWLLHEYTKSLELDFFILQSSLLSLLGLPDRGTIQPAAPFLIPCRSSPRRGFAGHGDQLVRLVGGRFGHRFGRSWRGDVVVAGHEIRFSRCRNAGVRPVDASRRGSDRDCSR